MFLFVFHSNDTEKYSQLQYSLIVDENTSLKDLEELLIQALVYRFMVFAYEVGIPSCQDCSPIDIHGSRRCRTLPPLYISALFSSIRS